MSIELVGKKQIAKKLKALSGKAAGSIARRSGSAGARVIRNEARRQVPEDSGNLKKAINVRVKQFRNKSGFHFYIAVDRGGKAKYDGWYAHFIEYGVQPHEIKPSKKAIKLNVSGDVLRAYANHPGIPAQPFMRPAFDSKRNEAVKVIGSKLWDNLKKEAKK